MKPGQLVRLTRDLRVDTAPLGGKHGHYIRPAGVVGQVVSIHDPLVFVTFRPEQFGRSPREVLGSAFRVNRMQYQRSGLPAFTEYLEPVV